MKKPVQNTPPRLKGMLISLQKYGIKLLYLNSKEYILADTLRCAHMEEATYQKRN